MRVGDVYKIAGMIESGSSPEEVINQFRNNYTEEEVRAFIPKKKRKTRKDKGVKKVRINDQPGSDL